MDHNLNLRGVACPMNFVKTRLFLDKIQAGDLLHLILDGGEPVESVCKSLEQEGQEIVSRITGSEGEVQLTIRKV